MIHHGLILLQKPGFSTGVCTLLTDIVSSDDEAGTDCLVATGDSGLNKSVLDFPVPSLVC